MGCSYSEDRAENRLENGPERDTGALIAPRGCVAASVSMRCVVFEPRLRTRSTQRQRMAMWVGGKTGWVAAV